MTATLRPDISVVVPTFKRDELLRRCLIALARQDMGFERYEVVVVDDGLSETTAGVIGAIASEYPGFAVRLLPGRQAGPATARNIGWRAASAPIIAFTDDDAFAADEHWLSTGLERFQDAALLAVSGRVAVPADDPPTDFQRNVKALEQAEFVTCNAFCRRSALEAVDGFDERFRVPFREDSDLQFRLEQLGRVVLRDEGLRVVHPAPPGPFGVSLKLQRYSMFNALLFKKHPQRYRQMQPLPPLHYYGIVLSLLSLVAGFAAGKRALTWGGFAAWAYLYGSFFRRRIRETDRSRRHLADMALTSLLIPFWSIYWRLRGALRFRQPFL